MRYRRDSSASPEVTYERKLRIVTATHRTPRHICVTCAPSLVTRYTLAEEERPSWREDGGTIDGGEAKPGEIGGLRWSHSFA